MSSPEDTGKQNFSAPWIRVLQLGDETMRLSQATSDAAAASDDIEITPEMIEAGSWADVASEDRGPEETLTAIYRAMASLDPARRKLP
jgi:hypothetical protein